MTGNELLKTMLHCTVKQSNQEQAAIQALQRADISPDAAYYNGAKKNVLDALNGAEKETALPFWEDYYTALIRQYKTMQTEQGRQQTAEAAKTVQAILYALRETEKLF